LKPAFSVILFSSSSGAGLGLAVWLLAWQLAGGVDAGGRAFWFGAALSALLFTVGLLSSTFHLANPRNAWRSFTRFSTSWLSREGVLAALFYPVAAVHLWLSWAHSPAARLTAALLIALALGIVACTGMIYACLKTIPRWRSWHVPVGYLLFALASGLLLWLAIDERPTTRPAEVQVTAGMRIAMALMLACVLLKAAYWLKFAQPAGMTIASALGFPGSRVRLLDAGHTGATFLTAEFGFALARERSRLIKGWALLLMLPVPLLLLRLLPDAHWLAALVFFAGVLLERWLFFAEAQHVVRLGARPAARLMAAAGAGR
jgi:sulfite dehydrogenase (quinone) subunit SoeC